MVILLWSYRKEGVMQMPAGQFKAKCLKLMDEVREFHKEIVVTKRGKPVARLVPVQREKRKPVFGFLQGLVRIHGDLVAPTGEYWHADA
jgi:prevent-host-death family protein